MPNETEGDTADKYVPSDAMVALTVHVPLVTAVIDAPESVQILPVNDS
jgi:hypothetical protein